MVSVGFSLTLNPTLTNNRKIRWLLVRLIRVMPNPKYVRN